MQKFCNFFNSNLKFQTVLTAITFNIFLPTRNELRDSSTLKIFDLGGDKFSDIILIDEKCYSKGSSLDVYRSSIGMGRCPVSTVGEMLFRRLMRVIFGRSTLGRELPFKFNDSHLSSFFTLPICCKRRNILEWSIFYFFQKF